MGCMCSALMQVQNTDVLSTLTDSFFFHWQQGKFRNQIQRELFCFLCTNILDIN